MKRFYLIAAMVLLRAQMGLAGEPLPQMSLRIEEVKDESDERIVYRALSGVPNIKIVSEHEPNVLNVEAVSLSGAEWDVGDLARAVTKVKSPEGPQDPRVFLVLQFKGDTRDFISQTRDLQTLCATLSGVDSRQC